MNGVYQRILSFFFQCTPHVISLVSWLLLHLHACTWHLPRCLLHVAPAPACQADNMGMCNVNCRHEEEEHQL